MTLQSEISDGLSQPNWNQSLVDTKKTVANALSKFDRSMKIVDTSYFNHSFIPDFVLSWPRDAGRSRNVFLRMELNPQLIQTDIKAVQTQRPMILNLAGLGPQEDYSKLQNLNAEAHDFASIVLEPDSVERLSSDLSSENFDRVLTSAILKGGHGFISTSTAGSLSEASKSYFHSVAEHDSEGVRSAIRPIQQFLDNAQDARILEFGRIVWDATGARIPFPLQTSLSPIDDVLLSFLLEEASESNLAFWRRIGNDLTLERLLSLGTNSAKNLDSLIRANADRINCRWLMVKDKEPQLEVGSTIWKLESGALVYEGGGFTAYLASRREDFALAPDSTDGISVSDFELRLRNERVEAVTLLTPNAKKVTIESNELFNPTNDEILTSLRDEEDIKVLSAGISANGKKLVCDFTNRTASGHTNASFDMITLFERGLPLLCSSSDDSLLTEIEILRTSLESSEGPRTLFDT